jgi:hypothetical protein
VTNFPYFEIGEYNYPGERKYSLLCCCFSPAISQGSVYLKISTPPSAPEKKVKQRGREKEKIIKTVPVQRMQMLVPYYQLK